MKLRYSITTRKSTRKSPAISDTQKIKTTIAKVETLKNKISTKQNSYTKEKSFFEENDSCPTCGQGIEEHFKHEKVSLLSDKLAEVEKAMSDLGQQLSNLQTQENNFILLTDEINQLNSKNRQLKNDINSLHRRIEDLDRDIRKLRDTMSVNGSSFQFLNHSTIKVKKSKKSSRKPKRRKIVSPQQRNFSKTRESKRASSKIPPDDE